MLLAAPLLLAVLVPLAVRLDLDLVAAPAEDRPAVDRPDVDRLLVRLVLVADEAFVLGLDRVAVARAIVINCLDFMML
ncbi:MAG: hypothetical protein DHS20C16_14260 [Phycisphaerae bacterium]|nr:MAG: hypothetical protein DHS20C16_14260 [Phycisphaerae bacterium]